MGCWCSKKDPSHSDEIMRARSSGPLPDRTESTSRKNKHRTNERLGISSKKRRRKTARKKDDGSFKDIPSVVPIPPRQANGYGDVSKARELIWDQLSRYYFWVTEQELTRRVNILLDSLLALRVETHSVLVDYKSPGGILGGTAALFYQCQEVIVIPDNDQTRNSLDWEMGKTRAHSPCRVVDPKADCVYRLQDIPDNATHLVIFSPDQQMEMDMWTSVQQVPRSQPRLGLVEWVTLDDRAKSPNLADSPWFLVDRSESDQAQHEPRSNFVLLRHLPKTDDRVTYQRQEAIIAKTTVPLLDSSDRVEVVVSPNYPEAGYGLIARGKIHKGEFIIKYGGIDVDPKVMNRAYQPGEEQKVSTDYVFEMEDPVRYIDGRLFLAGKVNDPVRSKARKKMVNVRFYTRKGDGLINEPWIQATKDMEDGEELLISYGAAYWNKRGTPQSARTAVHEDDEEEEASDDDEESDMTKPLL